jgi:hypothetical protein
VHAIVANGAGLVHVIVLDRSMVPPPASAGRLRHDAQPAAEIGNAADGK